jgi:hypothetical protein
MIGSLPDVEMRDIISNYNVWSGGKGIFSNSYL